MVYDLIDFSAAQPQSRHAQRLCTRVSHFLRKEYKRSRDFGALPEPRPTALAFPIDKGSCLRRENPVEANSNRDRKVGDCSVLAPTGCYRVKERVPGKFLRAQQLALDEQVRTRTANIRCGG